MNENLKLPLCPKCLDTKHTKEYTGHVKLAGVFACRKCGIYWATGMGIVDMPDGWEGFIRREEVIEAVKAWQKTGVLDNPVQVPEPGQCPSEGQRLAAKLSRPSSNQRPPTKHRALAQQVSSLLMGHGYMSTKIDFVGEINALEAFFSELEKDGMIKVHEQFYQD